MRLLRIRSPNKHIAIAYITDMSRRVPLTHFIISLNVLTVSWLHFRLAPAGLTLAAPAAIIIICMIRGRIWAKRAGQQIPEELAVRQLAAMAKVAAAITGCVLIWTLAVLPYGTPETRSFAITSLFGTVISCLFCFIKWRYALYLQTLIVVFPLSAVLLSTGSSFASTTGASLALICAGVLWASQRQNFDFESLVDARTTAQAQNAQNAHLATIDVLTSLPNRRQLELHVARDRSAGDGIAVGVLDLDGFKSVNDNYGHSVGDELIRIWASDVQAMLDQDCFISRLGGDEFALVMRGAHSATRIEEMSRRILKRMRRPFRVGSRVLSVGVTVGLAAKTNEDIDAGELLRRADVAMYAAKRAGKMRIEWFSPEFDRRRAVAHGIEGDLREALQAGRFALVYQPIVDARDESIRSVEAFLRWQRPEGREIGPAVFIPIAEETGLIDELGLWVLRQACMDARRWSGVKLAVNYSAAQLRNPELIEHIVRILHECRFPPQRLEIEITECYVLSDQDAAKRMVQCLSELGIGVVLDDFGTGGAAVGWLAEMPFAKLKVDRSFAAEAITGDVSRAIVQAGIIVARSLKMSVVAEGVETQDQAAMMRLLGCDELQGWLYAEPCDAAGIDALLGGADGLRPVPASASGIPGAA